MKPIIILLLFITLFATIGQATSSVVHSYTGQDETTVEASWWQHPLESLGNLFRDITGSEEVASVLTSDEYTGTEWYITPSSENANGNYETNGMGIMSSEGDPPFGEMSGNEEKGEDAAKMFMAFQYWGSQYGVYSAYNWNTNVVGNILNSAGRYLGGTLLMAASVLGHFAQLLGELLYELLDTFNVFQYILPESTSGETLLSEWQYSESSNPVMAYFSEWLNFGRWFGYIVALFLFVAGMGLSVLGFRVGKGRGMAGSMGETTKRLLVSVFSLTGAIFMLSGMITMFADRMQGIDDNVGVDGEVSELILDYKGFVTAGYAYDENGVDIDNQSWNVQSDDVESLKAVEDIYNGSGGGTGSMSTIRSSDIKAMNDIAGVTEDGGINMDEVDGSIDYIRNFWNFDSTQLINGWMRGTSTASSDMSNIYGDNSMLFALYRVHTNKDGVMKIEDDGILSAQYKYKDYTIPGGVGGFFRYTETLLTIGLVTFFAFHMYFFMAGAIYNMVKNVILWFPSGAGLGSIGGLSMLFGAVITMFIQIFIARSMIALFRDALTGIHEIFPSLMEMTGGSGTMTPLHMIDTGPLAFGTIFPFGAGTESLGEIALGTVLTGALGIMMYKGFLSMNNRIGSSSNQFFIDMASRISGIRPNDLKGKDGGGGDTIADGDVTADESEGSAEDSSYGSFSDSDASQMGLAGSVMGAVGAGSTAGAVGDSLGGQATGDTEDFDESLAHESALGGSSGQTQGHTDSEEALGGVGDDAEEETETTESSTSGSSTSTTDDDSNANELGDISNAQDFQDADEAMGSVGDDEEESERERRNLEHISAEQELDEDGQTMGEEALGGDYSDMDSEEEITETETLHASQDQEMDLDEGHRDQMDQTANADQAVENEADDTIDASNGDISAEREAGAMRMNDDGYLVSGDMNSADELIESDAGDQSINEADAGLAAATMSREAGDMQEQFPDDEQGAYDIGDGQNRADESIEARADGGSLHYDQQMADQDIFADTSDQDGYNTLADDDEAMAPYNDTYANELDSSTADDEDLFRESDRDAGDISVHDEENQENPFVNESMTDETGAIPDINEATTTGTAVGAAGLAASHLSNNDGSSDETLRDEVGLEGDQSIDQETVFSDNRGDADVSYADSDMVADSEGMYDTSSDNPFAEMESDNQAEGSSYDTSFSENGEIQDDVSVTGQSDISQESQIQNDQVDRPMDQSGHLDDVPVQDTMSGYDTMSDLDVTDTDMDFDRNGQSVTTESNVDGVMQDSATMNTDGRMDRMSVVDQGSVDMDESVQSEGSSAQDTGFSYNVTPDMNTTGYDTSLNGDGQSVTAESNVDGVMQDSTTMNTDGRMDRMSVVDQGSVDMDESVQSEGSSAQDTGLAYDTTPNMSASGYDTSLNGDNQSYDVTSDANGISRDSSTIHTHGEMNRMSDIGQGSVDMNEANEQSASATDNESLGHMTGAGSLSETGRQFGDQYNTTSEATDQVDMSSDHTVQSGAVGNKSTNQYVREGSDLVNENINEANTFQDDIETHAPNQQQNVRGTHQSLDGYATNSDVTSTFSGENRDSTTVNQSGTYDTHQDVTKGSTYVNNERQGSTGRSNVIQTDSDQPNVDRPSTRYANERGTMFARERQSTEPLTNASPFGSVHKDTKEHDAGVRMNTPREKQSNTPDVFDELFGSDDNEYENE